MLNSIEVTPQAQGQGPLYAHLMSGSNIMDGVSSVNSRQSLGSRYVRMPPINESSVQDKRVSVSHSHVAHSQKSEQGFQKKAPSVPQSRHHTFVDNNSSLQSGLIKSKQGTH